MWQIIEWLSSARISVTLLLLLTASLQDVKEREVSDKIWVSGILAGLIIDVIDFISFPDITLLTTITLSFSAMFLLSLLTFYLGFFGGADSKALITIALLNPYHPIPSLQNKTLPIFTLSVFLNSLLVSMTVPLALFLKNFTEIVKGKKLFENLEKTKLYTLKKTLLMFTGYKTKITELNSKKFVLPLEEIKIKSSINQEGIEKKEVERKIKFLPEMNKENQEENYLNLKKMVKEGEIKNQIWVSPGLPFILFLLTGYILTLVLGDILTKTILSLNT